MKAERFDILKVIGRYVAVEKQGAAYVALCPFHADRHPSLRINPLKGLYHCFSCGAGGDVIRFVMEKETCDFKAALHICEDICGTTHISSCRDGACPVSSPRNGNLKYYRPAGDGARPVSTTGDMNLRPYDPGDEGLRQAYADFGVGLAPPEPPKEYAFTRGRLVFPIYDGGGTIVAYAARYLGDPLPKGCAKYLNSPTSDLYKKDELLYGWHRALPRIRETGTIILVEGYKDALAMHAAGLTNTVALCGVNLSDYSIAMLRKEARLVCLFLDNDGPGRTAAAKIEARLRPLKGLTVVDVQPSALDGRIGEKDADEIYRTRGPEALRSLLSDAMIPPALRAAEDDLVKACQDWPDTACLTPEGDEIPYLGCILDTLAADDLWPGYGRNRAGLKACSPRPADLSVSLEERARRSRSLRQYFLRYLELRLADRIRERAYRLPHIPTGREERDELLRALQYDREYLREVSRELNRR